MILAYQLLSKSHKTVEGGYYYNSNGTVSGKNGTSNTGGGSSAA